MFDVIQQSHVTGTTPTSFVVSPQRAERWHLMLKAHSGNSGNITAVRWRKQAVPGGSWGPWESIDPALVPIAADGTASVIGVDDCTHLIEVETTADAVAQTVVYDFGTSKW